MKHFLRLASKRVPAADVVDNIEWNTCRGLTAGAK